MLLKAAINGGTPRSEQSEVPRTTEQIVAESLAVVAAGANVVHAHMLTPEGEQTIAPDAVGAWVRAMRAADPDVIIGTTTGMWTVSSHEERMAHVAAWPADALPDFASSAFREAGAAEMAELILERGMALESAVWSMDDVPALLASSTLRRNVRVLIEPEVEYPDVAVAQCRQIAAVLRAGGVTAPILYHGFDDTVWPIVRAAITDGCETRIGFEDGLLLPDGTPARVNAQLVTAVRALEIELQEIP